MSDNPLYKQETVDGRTASTWSPAAIFARPTADKLWRGPAQQAALRHLFGPEPEKFLLGPPSSGKSTLLRFVVAQSPDALVLQCRGAQQDPSSVLSALLISAELAPWQLADVDQRNLLTVFIQRRRAQDRRVMLLFDDVDRYAATAREEIDRLRSLHGRGLLGDVLILAGDEPAATLYPLVNAPGQAAAAVHCLPRVAPDDVLGYLRWRLSEHGVDLDITRAAGRLLHRCTQGRYAAIDIVFQMALLLLKRHCRERVDARLVKEALISLRRRHERSAAERDRSSLADTPHANPPPGHLLISRDGSLLQRRPLAPRLLLGRSEHNDVCLASPYLGRHHAVIVGTPEGYYVADLHSANGLRLNGKHVGRGVLNDGDVLSLGPFRLKLVLDEPLAWGNPLPGTTLSAADTARMPQLAGEPPPIRRVK